MQYVMLIAEPEHVHDVSEAEQAEIYAKIGDWFGKYGAEGKILGGHELQPVSTATTVRFVDGKPLVTDGPFVESKEIIGGYAVLNCADLDEALEMAKSWPSPWGVLEVRPVVDHEGGSGE